MLRVGVLHGVAIWVAMVVGCSFDGQAHRCAAAPPGELSRFVSRGRGEERVAAGARLMRTEGVAVFRAALGSFVVNRCLKEATSRLASLLDLVRGRLGNRLGQGTEQHDAHGGRFCFAEVCSHDVGRFNVRLPTEGQSGERPSRCLQLVLSSGGADWLSLVARLFPRGRQLVHAGFMITEPGTPSQDWHTDGSVEWEDRLGLRLPTYAVNVYLPLVALTPYNGPLEFLPGSHVEAQVGTGNGSLAHGAGSREGGGACSSNSSPVLVQGAAGDAVLYDYRLLHRGTRNTGMPPNLPPPRTQDRRKVPPEGSEEGQRPVLYLTFATSWFRGAGNFTNRSVFDAG